ncbi:toll-like receptor 4 [Haliotis cracherodii]|uniref:toll-like receptor 4 n=1 Tax=Haliotis cracherodii TaxID=6455 RepID=UPI0039EA468D
MTRNSFLAMLTIWLAVLGLPCSAKMYDFNSCIYNENDRDIVANCSNRNFTDVPQGFVENVTVIDLSQNEITSIEKMSFPYRLMVHTLSMSWNSLTHLDRDSLKNLPHLSKLDLRENKINCTSSSLPPGLFRDLPLKRLLLSDMNIKQIHDDLEYAEETFLDLNQLEELAIDSPPNPTFGVGFRSLTNLRTLTISFCQRNSLNTSAFEVFTKFNLTAFQINACNKGQVDTNITDVFPYLDILDIRNTVNTDLSQRLVNLNNYENASMQRISFIANTARYEDRTEQCFTLSKKYTRFLVTMCVSEVYLVGNRIRIIEREALIQPPFSQCIRVLDLSHNMILEEYHLLQTLFFFTHLASFHFEQYERDLKQYNDYIYNFYDSHSIFQGTNGMVWPENEPQTCVFSVSAETRESEVNPQSESSVLAYPFFFPRNLTSLYFAPALRPFVDINHDVYFLGSERWSKVVFSNCSVVAYNVSIFGLNNLQSLEISGNGFIGQPTTLMKSFPNIKNLSLIHITEGFEGIANNIESVLGHFQHLQNLHLLDNDLSDLPRNVEKITNIRLIDVSYNSIKELSVGTRKRLDAVAQKKNISVNLRGNVLSCGCGSLEFISWSMDSLVSFVDGHHYMCRNDDGEIIHITNIADSYMKIWRSCVSFFWLLFSICLFFLLFLGLSLSLHIARNVNLLKRWSVKWLGLDFQRHFKYDVFVYHSSKDDRRWVCSTLKQKLEDERDLRLCIPDRDFEPGVYTCEEVLGAINNSWKIIIYLTQTFLEDELCSFRLSSAVYLGDNLKSDRFIILFSDAVFRHPLPPIINQLLDEDNRFPLEEFHKSSLWDQLHSRILSKD